MPPCRGSIVPSSAKEAAPAHARAPENAQTTSAINGDGTLISTTEGEAKYPGANLNAHSIAKA